MSSSKWLRRAVRVGLVATLFATLVLPAAPANAGQAYSQLRAHRTITRDRVAYRVDLLAQRQGNTSQTLTVNISKTLNPDGVALSTQTWTWYFFSLENVFSAATNFSSGTLNTGSPSQIRPLGASNLTFAPTAAMDHSCNGHNDFRNGKLSGTGVLKTGTATFGDVPLTDMAATLFRTDGQCPALQNPAAKCEAAGRTMYAYKGTNQRTGVYASRVNNADTAWLSSSLFDSLSLTDPGTSGVMFALISTRVPGANVVIGEQLGSATVKGAAGTYHRGTLNFTANAPATTNEPSDCGPASKNLETVRTTRDGKAPGNMIVDWFSGPNGDFSGTAASASAEKHFNRVKQ